MGELIPIPNSSPVFTVIREIVPNTYEYLVSIVLPPSRNWEGDRLVVVNEPQLMFSSEKHYCFAIPFSKLPHHLRSLLQQYIR